MDTRTVLLQSREFVADRTMAFHFEKPAGFEFKPGQAIDLALARPGVKPSSSDFQHTFSLVSAPGENELIVATRMRDSAFKRALGALPVGASAEVKGPFGSLTLHKKQTRAAVLVAGGIGVTPFMSMLRQAVQDLLPQDLRLLCSNRRPEDTPFLQELQLLEQRNPHFRLIATMTDMTRSQQSWNGYARRIDSEMIRHAVQGLADPVFYVSGPPTLVGAVRQVLATAGVDDDDVRSEEFYGY